VSVFIERLVHETYAAHCILTNAGLRPEEIFVSVQPVVNAVHPGLHGIVLVRRGEQQFVLTLQPVTEDQAQRFLDAWREFAQAKPQMTRDTLDRIVYGSVLYEQRVHIVAALTAKGFELCGVLN
jgi:hypothetical protein